MRRYLVVTISGLFAISAMTQRGGRSSGSADEPPPTTLAPVAAKPIVCQAVQLERLLAETLYQ